ncbi:autotransporter-associated beta strand repeat-containing protein [Pseudomonas aeruginosa]|nr:autotransporter-associated beta strand repeat-containing protein [Pseudomonas aeruginosa]
MALADQPGSFNSGWDGRSLTKDGEGLLMLSNPDNSYSGVTTVARGVPRTQRDGRVRQRAAPSRLEQDRHAGSGRT